MSEFDPQRFGQEMTQLIKDYVGRQLTPLTERATALEARLAQTEARLGELEAKLSKVKADVR